MTPSESAGAAEGRLLVVGAGTMGAQIAQQAALHGIDVSLVDVDAEHLQRAMASNRQWLDRRVEKGRMERADADARCQAGDGNERPRPGGIEGCMGHRGGG